MDSMLYRRHRFLGGIKHFWMDVRVWDTNLVLEDLARQKWTQMWPKWWLSWDLIDVWQSEWSVVSLIGITEPSTTFWPRNWACRKFVQSWFQKKPHHRTKEKTKECVSGPSWTHRKWRKCFKTCHYGWWIVGFRARSRNQTTKFGVPPEHLTAPEESYN